MAMTHLGTLLALLCLSALCCRIDADLRSDLRDFMALVPRRRIGYIAARYYIFDPQFRQASEFLRSDEFSRTWRQIRASPDSAQLLEYLSEQVGPGYDVGGLIEELFNRLRSHQIARVVPVEMMLHRDLTTFLREMMQSLPRAQVYSLVARKQRESKEFARLYKALRNKEFRERVQRARNSRNLKAPLAKLAKNHIKVDELIQMVYELISWGPQSASA